ncbi:IreB family regulatory phosphoprotein, partial [Dysosmobacter welbionis]
VVIVLRPDQLQKLPGAGHSQLRIAEHDKRADVQVIRHFADGQVPAQARHGHGIRHIRCLLFLIPSGGWCPGGTVHYYIICAG